VTDIQRVWSQKKKKKIPGKVFGFSTFLKEVEDPEAELYDRDIASLHSEFGCGSFSSENAKLQQRRSS
jgi:hypothetical protein